MFVCVYLDIQIRLGGLGARASGWYGGTACEASWVLLYGRGSGGKFTI
jgi:hypothetical protein